jgi:phospholipase/carboxylesterase
MAAHACSRAGRQEPVARRVALLPRRSVGLTPAVVLVATALGCSRGGEQAITQAHEPSPRLAAKPQQAARACAPGVYDLTRASGRRALLHVTPSADRGSRGLLLALHGAGSGGAPGGLWIFRDVRQTPGLAIVAPAAAGVTWSLDSRDVDFVNLALRRAFARCRVDPRRVAVGGFSAGAGLALWLGLTNGDLFHDVVALSPGNALPRPRVGKPRVFPAHGTRDRVIPIAQGGDSVARQLRNDGYNVVYRRFEGGHRVLPQLAGDAVRRALVP